MKGIEKIEVFKRELKKIDKDIEDLKMIRIAIDGYIHVEEIRIMIDKHDAECTDDVNVGEDE